MTSVYVWLLLIGAGAVLLGNALQAQTADAESVDQWLDLPLEQLLRIKVAVPAAMTKFSLAEVPASVTVITAEDIAASTARNIYDLLEIYVPGAIWMNHEKGPHPGIRGLITNQNYKYLLMVNGRVLNNKGYFGAKSELEMWELGDIRRIEVIRGPGSVTYGAGAIAGVIHIVSFDGSSRAGAAVSATAIHPFGSNGFSYAQSGQSEDFSWYAYGSVRQTEGVKPDMFVVTPQNQVGYVGKDVQTNQVPLDYFADIFEPQIKTHIDMNFGKEWRLWLRYTQQGSTWTGNETKSLVNGKMINQQSTRDRQATITLERKQELDPRLTLQTMLSVDSMDSEGRKDRMDDPDPDHPLNFRVNFAEHEILLRSKLNWQISDALEYAVGAEYSRDYFGTGWGDDKREMRLGEGGNIVSGQDSKAIREGNRGSADRTDNAFFVGEGWETTTYSLFSEANYEWIKGQKLLISGRADKNTYTRWLLSPRIAVVSQLADRQLLKLIVQRSVRMNTAGQIYTEHASGKQSTDETLDAAEIIYSYFPQDQIAWQFSGFRNHLRDIGFEGDENLTKPLGTLDLYGLEAEFFYKKPGLSYGINYSYVKQLKWELANGETSSGVSYSDFDEDVGDGHQNGFGNDLNNWPNHAIKMFGHIAGTSQINLNADARVFWHWQGEKDGLAGLVRALDGTPDQETTVATIEKLEEKGVYGPDYRLDLSVAWQVSPPLRITLFSRNLIDFSGNKRYSYDSGNDEVAPQRVRFIEEPLLLGVKVDWNL